MERRHLPRARLSAVLPLEVESGGPVLPDIVLWALHLAEGDLLPLRRSSVPESFRFQSYLADLESLVAAIQYPWPYIESLLRQPMAAVGPRGTLLLPEEAAALIEPQGGQLVLRVEPPTEWLFQIGLERQPTGPATLRIEKEYTLPVVDGCRVTLPGEALWLLGLPEGGKLACKTSFAQADFEPAPRAGALGDRSWVELGPDGTLDLPAALRKLFDEIPRLSREARLTVHPPGFRIGLEIKPVSGRPFR